MSAYRARSVSFDGIGRDKEEDERQSEEQKKLNTSNT